MNVPEREPNGGSARRDDPTDPLTLQAIIDASSDCIKVLDLDAHLLSMNVGGIQTMEIDDFSLCKNLLWPTFWEGDARLEVERALEAARKGEATGFEGPARTFAGTPKWWEVRVSPIRDEHGVVTRILAVSRDVTARKALEEQLYDRERQLRERAETLEVQAGQNERALDAFVRFTTQVASSTDLTVLASAASDILREVLGGATSGFYLIRGETAFPQVFSSNTPREVQEKRQRGISLHTPLAVEALRSGRVAFAEEEQARSQSVGHASALSVTPYFLHGKPYALFATGTLRPHWTAQERAIVRSVGQGLGLALERAQKTEALEARNTELDAQTQALDAFMAYTEAVGTETDVPALTERAFALLGLRFPDFSCGLYTLEQNLWRLQIHTADLYSTPELLALLKAGLPTTTPGLQEAAAQQQPVFTDAWNPEQGGIEHSEAYGTSAAYPIVLGDTVDAVLAIGVKDRAHWDERDRAMFLSVGRGLSLALERAQRVQELATRTRQLEHSNTELRSANEELEAFTYSASHDLRTPVRHVMGFAELAQSALRSTPNEKAQGHLEVVKQAATRMTSLIDGMLTLSRSGRQELRVQAVALSDLVTQARRDVGAEFGNHPVRWQIGTLPVVQGDRDMLQQVLTNLLSNAVKYSSTREVSQVRVSAQEGESEWLVSVEDNGVGFDPQYRERLFGIFQRLHTEREFQGTGVGLATVKRIVQKHGGRIFAESTEGEGATFTFSLPRRELHRRELSRPEPTLT